MDNEDRRFEVYKLAFQHTEGEVGALWQRNQAFLVANSLLAVLEGQLVSMPWLAFWVAIFCTVISYLWLRANLYQHKWERYWIKACRELERDLEGCKLWTQAGSERAKKLGRPPLRGDTHEVYLSGAFIVAWFAVALYLLP